MKNNNEIIEEMERLIFNVNASLDKLESFRSTEEIESYLENFPDDLISFRDSFSLYYKLFGFDNRGTNLRNLVERILSLKGIFEKHYRFAPYRSTILDELGRREGFFAFSLATQKDITTIINAIEYINIRKKYMGVLIERSQLDSRRIRDYKDVQYEYNLFGSSLMRIKKNILNLSKDDVIRIVTSIDATDFFEEIITKSWKKMSFWEQNLIREYINTVLHLKVIFMPDKLEEDKIFKAVLEGKVQDLEVLKLIFDSSLSKYFVNVYAKLNGGLCDGYLIKMANHLIKASGNTAVGTTIIRYIVKQIKPNRECAYILSLIDVPNDYNELIENGIPEELKWLEDFHVFNEFKKLEKKLENSGWPFLPAEYYIKKINKANLTPEQIEMFVQNIYTLIHFKYYSKEDVQKLRVCLEQNFLWNDEEFGEFGKKIPFEQYRQEFDEHLAGKNKISKIRLKTCIRSMIDTILKENGIENEVIVLFGKQKGLGGFYQKNKNVIWINENLLEGFINEKDTSLFDIISHECEHAIQNNNIETGQIDFLTYNFIIEEIIKLYDYDFYNNNYKKMFKEIDARQLGLIGRLDWLYRINPQYARNAFEKTRVYFARENETYSIDQVTQKKMSSSMKYDIEVYDYLKLLIENNPEILIENPILNIQYHKNGQKKSIETMLDEFEMQEREGVKEEWVASYGENTTLRDINNLYFIYEGIISIYLSRGEVVDESIKKRLEVFFERKKWKLADIRKGLLVDRRRLDILFKGLTKMGEDGVRKGVSEEDLRSFYE